MDESDSSSLDRIMELLMLSGFSPEHAVNMCIPPAWENSSMTDEKRAFFEFQSLLMKPWDGPAAIVFTDGFTIGAHLDRNGLRPLRYTITDDGYMVLGSETGMIDLGERPIREKGRLGPGDTLSVDLRTGRLRYTDEIIEQLSQQRPYRVWLDHLYRLREDDVRISDAGDIIRKQIAFGYTSEEINTSMKEMAEKGREMTYSMGDDTPLPPLSEKPQLLFRYFKQRFSQVTNPPIDPIRERMVMSLRMALGHKINFLRETPEHAKRLLLDSPILFESHIRHIEEQRLFEVERIDLTYSTQGAEQISAELLEEGPPTSCIPGTESLMLFAVRRLQRKVVDAVKKGVVILLLSDRLISEERMAIPSLLAVSASFKALQRGRLVNRASLIIESGEARDIHQMACLIGYGASAIHPYMAFQIIKDLCDKGLINIEYEKAALNYVKALEDGLLKVLARMGISTLNSYYAAQLFDSVCLNQDFVEEFFGGTTVVIDSDGIAEIEESVMSRHISGFEAAEPVMDFGGNLRHRKGGEWHQWSLFSVALLNRFVRSGEEKLYREFSTASAGRPVSIRDLLDFKKGQRIPIEEVEKAEDILKRFFSGAMSVGALSPEAHERLAEACNILGIRSNSGEGGEDPARYWTIKNSAIKQIASGRFGVTPAYIASATELEIKIAQGAKPGEGGHLPAIKVTEYIAGLRHCAPGMLLISPPPHHDIYSIEDLAQLINDLKEANPAARICVKLVSENGVGTVAAGVAKSYADIIQICGGEGGTGASPIGSIKNAGGFWETGLAETQRVLIENGLRERVKLRADGGLRTGRDIIIAAMLGAEEFGFGTAAMISIGCVMARQCHLNTCPTGVATQDEKLRQKFRGSVQGVISYFSAVAREVREIMSEMGFRSMDEIIGRSDLLTEKQYDAYPATKRIKLDKIIGGYSEGQPRKCTKERNDNPSASLNDLLVDDLLPYIGSAEKVEREYRIRNIHRSVPLKLNYHIALKYRDDGLPPDTLKLRFTGTAGQSFGAFNHKGVSLTLIGDANDYVGKSMFGGRIVIKPDRIMQSHTQVIAGNTVLYGATGGEFYAAGLAGERFAVRNSGATAVVEGSGDHLCEYMTRGTVVVLGEVGHNVGAGMTGGVIHIFDEAGTLEERLNSDYVKVIQMEDDLEVQRLKSMMEDYHRYTGSPFAEEILSDFRKSLRYFRKVVAR
jgi:glutamate synthase (NADPH/NADH) large chain